MKHTKKTNRPFSASNRKGLLEDFFDFLFTVLLAFFAFSFVYIFMVESTDGDTEEKKVRSLDFATDLLYQTEGHIPSRSGSTDLNSDLAALDSAEKAIASSERWVLDRRVAEKTSRAEQILLEETGNLEAKGLFSLNWQDTEYLQEVIAESVRQGIDPCYGIVTILHESLGNPQAVGNDANVVGCVVQARRILLMHESPNCKAIYLDEAALRKGCLENKVTGESLRWDKPRTQVNACLDDFLDAKRYNSPKPSKEEFCSQSGNFKLYLRYGVGLGQLTPETGASGITIGDTKYSYCDLFDPLQNIKALVAQLKLKGASTASSAEEIQHVFGKYIGIATLSQGVDRYQDYLICKKVMEKKSS